MSGKEVNDVGVEKAKGAFEGAMDTEILEYEDLEAFFKTIDSNFDSNTDEKDMLILYELTGLMLQGDDEIDDNEITSSGQSKVSANKV